MFLEEEFIESRKKVASLIEDCLWGGKLVREALKEWPATKYDKTILCAKHALIHYEADYDYRMANTDYQDGQIEWLENIIKILSKGDPLPVNIIKTYEEYYPNKLDVVSSLVYYYYCFVDIINKLKKKFQNK